MFETALRFLTSCLQLEFSEMEGFQINTHTKYKAIMKKNSPQFLELVLFLMNLTVTNTEEESPC